jgi:ATP-binding cassette subfamily F protein uup
LEYPGALVLVTHDRYMLNRVSTTVLGLDGNGNTQSFADFSQWEDWMAAGSPMPERAKPAVVVEAPKPAPETPGAKKKLSYKDQREWDALEEKIAAGEARSAAADLAVASPAIAIDAVALQAALAEQDDAQAALAELYVRWEALAELAL